MEENIQRGEYSELKKEIGILLQRGREQAGRAINSILVNTYWQIGRHIVEFEQKGEAKAEYGSKLIDRLSKDLTIEYGQGFSRSNIKQIRKFYLTFPKSQTVSDQFEINYTLSHKLSWNHYVEILKAFN